MSDSKASLFGWDGHGRSGRHVAMIEVRTMHDAVRRSKVAFWAVGATVGLSTGVVASGITNPIRSVLIGLLAGVVIGFGAALVLFCWPVIRVAWHWVAEIVALSTFLGLYLLLTQSLPWWLALAILALGLLGPMGLPSIRRAALPWVWCGISRHRLRLCFAAFVASQRTGYRPLILLARPIPAGERVWIWLRPGLALADLEARLDRLAAGCWAAECRIAPASRRYSALLRIDIARRNPLAAMIGSPLPDLVPTVDATTGNSGYNSGGLDLPDVPDTPSDVPAEPKRRLRAVAAAPDKAEPSLADVVIPTGAVDDALDWI
jgi:hypothetical protein